MTACVRTASQSSILPDNIADLLDARGSAVESCSVVDACVELCSGLDRLRHGPTRVGAAQWVAMLGLLRWFWLLIEPLVRRRMERRKAHMGNVVVNFVSQSLQQELLFFSVPLMIGATQQDVSRMVFTAIAATAAVISTIDPLYERYIATRANRISPPTHAADGQWISTPHSGGC